MRVASRAASVWADTSMRRSLTPASAYAARPSRTCCQLPMRCSSAGSARPSLASTRAYDGNAWYRAEIACASSKAPRRSSITQMRTRAMTRGRERPTSGCRTSVQVRHHIGGNGARSALAQRGAVDAFAGEAQHAWAKGREEDRGVRGVNIEFGTGGQLLAHHLGRLARQQRLQTVHKIARQGEWAVPGDPHALLGLRLGRR